MDNVLANIVHFNRPFFFKIIFGKDIILNMDKELIIKICDSLIDQLTVLKGYMQLDKINNRIDHSIIITQEIEKLEKVVNELVNQLLEF